MSNRVGLINALKRELKLNYFFKSRLKELISVSIISINVIKSIRYKFNLPFNIYMTLNKRRRE